MKRLNFRRGFDVNCVFALKESLLEGLAGTKNEGLRGLIWHSYRGAVHLSNWTSYPYYPSLITCKTQNFASKQDCYPSWPSLTLCSKPLSFGTTWYTYQSHYLPHTHSLLFSDTFLSQSLPVNLASLPSVVSYFASDSQSSLCFSIANIDDQGTK
jgi:hypothetical protein